MSVTKRRLLFGFFLLLFILIGSGIVLYSMGWRINFDNFKIQKTGAISIRTSPRGVDIKINNKDYPDTSNIIQSETLITNLLPKTYKVEISKEGYQPYYKTTEVESSLVTRFLNVVLLPQKLKINPSILLKGNIFTDITNDSKNLLVGNTATKAEYLYNLNDASSTLNINGALNNLKKGTKIKKAAILPFNPAQLIIQDQGGLELFDTKELTYDNLIKITPIIWNRTGSTLFYIRKSDDPKGGLVLASFDLVFRNENILTTVPKSINTANLTDIKANGDGTIAFSENNGDLYLYSPNDKSTKKIGDAVKDFSFSPDSKKLAFLDRNGQINILFLKDFDGDIRKKAGDIIRFNLEDKDDVQAMEWYKDSYHLFVKFSDGFDFMEIDDRAPLNIYRFLDGNFSFVYSPDSNLFYFIDNSQLEQIDFNNL